MIKNILLSDSSNTELEIINKEFKHSLKSLASTSPKDQRTQVLRKLRGTALRAQRYVALFESLLAYEWVETVQAYTRTFGFNTPKQDQFVKTYIDTHLCYVLKKCAQFIINLVDLETGNIPEIKIDETMATDK